MTEAVRFWPSPEDMWASMLVAAARERGVSMLATTDTRKLYVKPPIDMAFFQDLFEYHDAVVRVLLGESLC